MSVEEEYGKGMFLSYSISHLGLMSSSTTSCLTFYPRWDSQLGYSMHMDTSGPARLSSTLTNAVVLVIPMGRGVSSYGIKIFHSLAQCGMLECV